MDSTGRPQSHEPKLPFAVLHRHVDRAVRHDQAALAVFVFDICFEVPNRKLGPSLEAGGVNENARPDFHNSRLNLCRLSLAWTTKANYTDRLYLSTHKGFHSLVAA